MWRASTITVLLLVALSCNFEGATSVAVIIPVRVGADILYFKHQVLGLNGDQTVISFSPDWRVMPSAGDCVYCALGPPLVLYSVDSGTLHLWDQSQTCWRKVPGARPVPVTVHQAGVLTLAELDQARPENGLNAINDWPLRKVRFWQRW
jgi:hypothetical protein